MIANDGLDEVDLAFVSTLVPEDALDVSLIAIVSWVDPDTGESRFKVYARTDALIATTLGMLELAKLDLVNASFDEDDE